MPRIDLADMYHYTKEVISARSCQLVALFDVLPPGAISVWEHVEFQGE